MTYGNSLYFLFIDIDFSSVRERCFLPEDLSESQLRRAIKYDAKGRLEVRWLQGGF